MVNFHLINLILYQYLTNNLHSVVLFHCWTQRNLLHFAETAFDQNIFIQFVNLNNSQNLQNIPYRYLRHQKPKLGVFLGMNCQGTEEVIQQTSRIRYFNQHYHWLIHDEKSNLIRFYAKFENVNLSVDADIAYVVPKQGSFDVIHNSLSFLVFDVYSNGRLLGGNLNITSNYELQCNVTDCHKSKYLTSLHKRTLYGNREALRDITMRIAVVVTRYDLKAPENELQKFLMDERDFHIDPLARLGFRISQIVIESLYTNVTYVYYNSWTEVDYIGGIVGALVNQTVDMTSAPFVLTPGRLQFLSPLAATGDFRMVCMFRTPRNSGVHGRVFLEPFSAKVWIIFGVILLMASIMLWLAFCMEYRDVSEARRIRYIPSLLTMCLISFGSACAQSSFLIPRSRGGRMVFLCLLILSFIMYNYYTSVVVSTLLGTPLKSKIKTLRDLAESDLEVGLEPLPYTYTYLNFSNLPDVKRFVKTKIARKKNFHSLWYSANEGIVKMRNKPGFVFVFESSTGYPIIEQLYEPHEICDLNEIRFRSDSLLFVHLHQNSSYKDLVRLKILRILETGVHAKHRRLWVRNHLNCLNSNLVINVGMEYAAPLFIMLLLGYGVVLLLLLLEILWKKWELRRRHTH